MAKKKAVKKGTKSAGIKAERAVKKTVRRRVSVPARRGRPTKFTKEAGVKILAGLAAGGTLTGVCADRSFPCRQTVAKWILEGITKGSGEKMDFAVHFKLACDLRAALQEDEFLQIIKTVQEMPLEQLTAGELERFEFVVSNIKWHMIKFRNRPLPDNDGLDTAIKRIAQAAGVNSLDDDDEEDDAYGGRIRLLKAKLAEAADE